MKKLLYTLITVSIIFAACGEKYGCIEGDCKNGKGTMYTKGYKYVGEYKDGNRHGKGTWTESDGSKYVGEWKNDKMNGFGKRTSANGKDYNEGIWKNNSLHGIGTEYWQGDIFVGEFEMGVKKKGKMTYRNGKVEEGLWENNRIKQ